MTDRRDLLRLLAGAAPALFGAGALSSGLRAQAQEAGLVAGNVCQLTPATTEGPYYLDPVLMRGDIREDRSGVPLTLTLQVVTPECRPIQNARVDIWHCDAQGNYSGVENDAGTYLRGSQMTDAAGKVVFASIFPGWYRGRTTHVHFKTWLGESEALTGQIFFPDQLATAIFDTAPDYRRTDMTGHIGNGRDGIAQRAGAGAFAEVGGGADGVRAAMVIGVTA